ncbi:MAG: M48 family metallopeptidase [Synergistaceae bacterium]|nr:M48 family metallopeptidase [Synergistaceae bacterium]
MKQKIFLILIFVLTFCACAQAAIDSATVEAAWKRIAETDGFKVVKINYEKDDSPNAWVKFKSQNDFSVHVTQGLMKILNSEEQIAGVLGHEIGHVRLGHYNKGVGRNVLWTILSLGLSRVGGTAGKAAQAAGSVGMNLAESGFSRGQEVEADDYGTELLKKAGYDPMGLYRAMKAFADNKYVTQPNGFNSHPPTARRLKHLMDKAKSLK